MLSKKLKWKYLNYFALSLAIIFNIFFPATMGYADQVIVLNPDQVIPVENTSPVILTLKVTSVKTVRVTAYSSSLDQCDNDPYTTASGAQVKIGTVAANCLPFGTKVRFPELFGEQIFIVEDRMNARYGCNAFDIWMPSRSAALNFGKQYATVEVF